MDSKLRTYAVLTCDIIRSQKFEADKLLEVLHRCINDVNSKYSLHLHTPLSIILGDMIQGVCKRPGFVFDIFQWLEEILWLEGISIVGSPVNVRCGIGVGKISNPMLPIGEMTGKAFIFANSALESLGKRSQMSVSAIVCRRKQLSNLLTSTMGVIAALKAQWDVKVREVILLSREAGSQLQVANRLNIKRKEVKSILYSAGWKQLIAGEKAIRKTISMI